MQVCAGSGGTRHRLAAPVLVAAILLGGCASGGSDTSSGPTTAAPAVSTTVTTEAPTTSTSTSTSTSTTTTTAPPDLTQLPEPAGPLQSGSQGTRTRAMQQALKDQHYDPGVIDGKFGGKVTMAVWAFQELHGLPSDGVVGPATEAQIGAKVPQAMLKPELGPTHTEVDLTKQVMIVWRNGAPSLISHVSTGSGHAYCEDTDGGKNCGDAVTPVGLYRFGRRVAGWRVAPLGRLYNPVYFNGGIAVHGAASVPDYPASHGCVRIPMSIAEYFPTLVNTGDQIQVFRS